MSVLDTSSFEGLNVASVSGVTWVDFMQMTESFIALDISVNSTGWGRWRDGVYETGIFSVEATKEESAVRRREFREFLSELFGDKTYEYVFVEKPIMGKNYDTSSALFQLNVIVDDMIDMNMLSARKIIREDNNMWKSNLHKASGFVSKIKGDKDIKGMVQESLRRLGFDQQERVLKEDEWDATGLAIGVIYRELVLKNTKAIKKPKTDIRKGFNVRQFDNDIDALEYAEKRKGTVYSADFTDNNKSIMTNFKELVLEHGSDWVFVLTIDTKKLGALALDKGLSLSYPVSTLVVWNK